MKVFKRKDNDNFTKMAKEGLLCEGGGLTAANLAKLGQTGINTSDNGSYAGSDVDRSVKKTKSRVSDSTHIAGLDNFKKYGDLFQDLTLRSAVDTGYDVVNVIITYDSKHCVAIVNNKDEYFELQGYSLTTYEQVFKKVYQGVYIKMNLIEQNDAGNIFAIAYQDNG